MDVITYLVFPDVLHCLDFCHDFVVDRDVYLSSRKVVKTEGLDESQHVSVREKEVRQEWRVYLMSKKVKK